MQAWACSYARSVTTSCCVSLLRPPDFETSPVNIGCMPQSIPTSLRIWFLNSIACSSVSGRLKSTTSSILSESVLTGIGAMSHRFTAIFDLAHSQAFLKDSQLADFTNAAVWGDLCAV